MFDNIGGKLKGLAKFVGIGGGALFVLIGIIGGVKAETPVVLLTCVILGLICVISAWPMYGFGQLIESLMDIEQMMKNGNNQQSSNKRSTSAQSNNFSDLPEL